MVRNYYQRLEDLLRNMKNKLKRAQQTSKTRSDHFFGRVLFLSSDWLAIFGGAVLVSIVLVSFFSILGRTLFSKSIVGDFELVEMGCAVAIFCFLPLCHLRRGNVTVDFFTLGLSNKAVRILDSFSSFLFLIVASIFCWRMVLGGIDMYRYNEQTMLLGLPVWIAFIPAVFSFFLLSLACFHTSIFGFQKESAD